MSSAPSKTPPLGRLGPSWVRRKWRALTAWMGDHLWLSIMAASIVAAAVLFYGVRLNGFAHLKDALGRWRVEVFGGTLRVERSIEVPDVILSFHREAFDRMDAVSSSAGFLGGTAFKKELREIARRPGARMRTVALDPRMGAESHPRHAAFAAEAKAFGVTTWEYAARCRYSAAVLIRLQEELGAVLEVRFLDTPVASATVPYFLNGRSVQLYRADDTAKRLDILVERPAVPDGMDSFSHPGLIIRHRPHDPQVKRFQAAFDEAWAASRPAEPGLKEEIFNPVSVSP